MQRICNRDGQQGTRGRCPAEKTGARAGRKVPKRYYNLPSQILRNPLAW